MTTMEKIQIKSNKIFKIKVTEFILSNTSVPHSCYEKNIIFAP